MKIIDARVRPRTPQILSAWTTELRPHYKSYIDLYKMRSRLNVMPMEELIATAAASEIDQMLICGNHSNDNDHILMLSAAFPNLIPVVTVEVSQGIMHALKEIERCREKGATAVYMAPYIDNLDCNDQLLYPIYGYCELLNIPLILHGGIHFYTGAYMWHTQPQFIDEIAVDFPELKLIISHAGNGFGPPMLAVAQRHPNLYLEFSALNPAYIAPEFLYAVNTYLKERSIFGSDYPLLDFKISIDRWKKVLRPEIKEGFFQNNILHAIGLIL